MIEVLDTLTLTDQDGTEVEVATMATFRGQNAQGINIAEVRVAVMPALARDNFEFCGHVQCWNNLVSVVDFSLS